MLYLVGLVALLSVVSASSEPGTAAASTTLTSQAARLSAVPSPLQLAPFDDGQRGIVGAWFVNAVGAPFQPHVMEFHSDGTLEIDNPESGDPHTSDSVGMGPYKVANNGNGIIGRFEEVNADRASHEYVSLLVVDFTLTLSANGETFTGPATANYYNPDGSFQQGPFPATLNGTRIQLPASPTGTQN